MRNLLKLFSICFLIFSSTFTSIAGNGADVDAKPIKLYQFQNVNALLGLVDKDRNIIIEAKYDYISKYVEGRAYYKVDGMYGFLDEFGHEITDAIYHEVSDFSEGFAKVGSKGNFGFINLEGEEIVPTKFAWASDFYGSAAEVETHKGVSFMIYTPEHDEYYEIK